MTPPDCTCPTCQSACIEKPGWFMPGEAEKVAEYLGITLPELFAEHLAIDWWKDDGDDERIIDTVFVLAPGIVTAPAGQEYPGYPKGQCRFFKDGRCSIHPVKPFECREAIHGTPSGVVHARHADVAVAWKDHQDQPTELLGDEPYAEPYTGGLLGMLGLFT
jgi:hypothetical protein